MKCPKVGHYSTRYEAHPFPAMIATMYFSATIPYPNIDPVALRVGSIAVRWYGLAYLAGFVVAYRVLFLMIRSGTLRISKQQLADLITYLAAGVILGGRLGWWLFYHRDPGHPEPWYEPIAIWHGGMSFHGGLVGVMLVLLTYCWKTNLPFLNVADALALVTPIGLFFGRIANFLNAELFGRPSNVPWAVVFPGEAFSRHPSQIYEALLEGPLLLLILWTSRRIPAVRARDGRVSALFLICYGIFRFVVEFTRQPDAQLGFIAAGWLTMGQLLSAVLVLGGIVLWIALKPSIRK